MPLNDARIRALKPSTKPTKHGDAGGLLLVVSPTGSKLWRMVYRFDGKQKQLSFGTSPDVSQRHEAWYSECVPKRRSTTPPKKVD